MWTNFKMKFSHKDKYLCFKVRSFKRIYSSELKIRVIFLVHIMQSYVKYFCTLKDSNCSYV